MVKLITTYITQKRLSWHGHVMRRHECYKPSNNDEDGREETSRKAQTEVDGPSAERHGREETSRKAQTEVDGQSVERHERKPARSKARTEPRSMEKGSHGDRHWTEIRSANMSHYPHSPINAMAHQ